MPDAPGRVSSWTDCLDGDCGKCDACRALAVREAQRHERENPPNEDEQMGAS